MGLKATCVGHFGKQISEGKAHLDSDHLLFRGEFRLKILFKDMKSVKADDGCLVISFPEGQTTFELASAAVKWADKILHPPQRIDKLGVKPGMCVAIVGIHDEDFHEESDLEASVRHHSTRLWHRRHRI